MRMARRMYQNVYREMMLKMVRHYFKVNNIYALYLGGAKGEDWSIYIERIRLLGTR